MSGVNQSDEDGKDSPRDHDAGNPASRAPAFDDEGSRNLQQDVADEEDPGAKAEHSVTEIQIAGHLQGAVSHIHSVEERKDIEQPEKRKQAAADATSGT